MNGEGPQGVLIHHLVPGVGQVGLHVPGIVVKADGAPPAVLVDKVEHGADQPLVGLRPEDGLVLGDGIVHVGGDGLMPPLQHGGAAGEGQQGQG